MKSLGKQSVLLDARYPDGSPCMAIMVTKTIYQRTDGSLFFMEGGKGRYKVERNPAGGLYCRHQNAPAKTGGAT